MVAQAVAKLKLDGKQFTDKLDTVGNNADNKLGKKFQALGTKIAGAFAVTEIVQFISKMVQLGDEIDNLADQTDLSVTGVQALKVAAEESGLKFETVRPAISAMRRAIDEAKGGSDAATESFKTLGISTDELRDSTTEEIFTKITKEMASANASAATFTASTKVLGAESTRLRSMLIDLGTEGFDEVKNKMTETGKVLDQDTVAVLDRFEQKAKDFTDGVRGDFARLTGQLLTFIEESTNLDSVEMKNVKAEIDGLKTSLDELRAKYQGILTAIQTAQENLESATKETKAAQDAYNQALFDAMTPAQKLEALRNRQKETETSLETSLENQKQLVIDIEQKENELLTAKNNVIEAAKKATTAAENHRDAVEKVEEFTEKYGRVLARNNTKDEELKQLKLAQKQAQEEMLTAETNAEQAKIRSATLQEELIDLKIDEKQEEENIYDAKQNTLALSEEIKGVEDEIKQAKIDQANAEKTVKDKINETIAAKETLRQKTQNEIAAIQELLNKEIEVNGESQRSIDLSGMLENKKKQLANLVGEQKDDEQEIEESIGVQLDAVKEMQQLFKTMTEEELNNLLTAIETIANRLKNLPKVQNLDWLKDLSNLRLQGLNETRAKGVAQFLETLVGRINDLPKIDKEKFAFLEEISDIDIKGLSANRGRMVGDFFLELSQRVERSKFGKLKEAGGAIKSVSDSLSTLDEFKMASFTAFISTLKDLSAGGGIGGTFSVNMPGEMPSFDLAMDSESKTAIENLETALENLTSAYTGEDTQADGEDTGSTSVANLANALNSLDTTKLSAFTSFISSLNDLSAGAIAGGVVDFNVPQSLPGFPLTMDSLTETTLTSIDSSLQSLAGMKGVVWH